MRDPICVLVRRLRRASPGLAAAVAACGGGGGNAPTRPAVTDSAGIAIVSSEAPDSVVVPTPAWTIGGGRDTTLINVTGLAMRADGTVLVANSGSAQVLAYGPDGALRWRFGRRGQGPGEFTGEFFVAAIGDTGYVYEFTTRDLMMLAPDGTLLRTLHVTIDEPNLELLGGLGDGSLLFAGRHLTGMKPGVNTDSVVYQRYSLAGISLGSVGWARGSNVDFVMADMGPNLDEQAFGASSAAATAGEWLARTTGHDAEVRLSDPNGRLRRILRWEEAAAPVTEADRAAYRAARLAATRSEMERRMVTDWLDHATFAGTVPVTGALAVGRDGRVAVATYCGPGTASCDWRLFDTDGRWRRTLRLPFRTSRAVLSGDLLVTLSVDDDGVERIDAWRW